MNWHRLGKLALVGIGTFAAILLGAFVLIRLMAPTVSLARMVAFNAVMFAVTGAVLAVVIWPQRIPNKSETVVRVRVAERGLQLGSHRVSLTPVELSNCVEKTVPGHAAVIFPVDYGTFVDASGLRNLLDF